MPDAAPLEEKAARTDAPHSYRDAPATYGAIEVALKGLVDIIAKANREREASLTAKIDAVTKALAAKTEMIASLERRASRHAEHLSKLEDRTKRLETKE